MLLNIGDEDVFLNVSESESKGAGAQKPQILWSVYFNMRDSSSVDKTSYDNLPSNVYVCSGPDGALGNDCAVRQVREACPFQRLAAESSEVVVHESSQYLFNDSVTC